MEPSFPETIEPEFDRRTLLSLVAFAIGGASIPGIAHAAGRSSDIVGMDAVSLRDAIRARKLSCVEVMNAYLDQIGALNPTVNAIVSLQDRAGLVKQAEARDAQIFRKDAVGPLHGLPHAAKDLVAVAGLPFTAGSPIFKDRIAKADAVQAARLRDAGVVFIGKTNTPELGLGSHTFNPVFGATRNAYDPSKSAGGSSGGAAVGLALHMLPLADGSDYGGSLRNPAGWNNVYGFRTSIGRVPATARDVWLPTMGVTGPMARNVRDLALLLAVQAGYDAGSPLSMESGRGQFQQPLHAEMKGKRIAWAGDFNGAIPYEAGVLDLCRNALKSFEDLGCHVEEACPVYPVDKAWNSFVKLRGWQQGGGIVDLYNDPARRALLKPEAVYEVEQGLGLSAFDVTAHSVIRSEWSEAVRTFFQRYDFWIMPTAQTFPFDVDQRWPSEIAGHKMNTYHEWMKAVCLLTMSGCPALAAPAGFASNGLPMGIQIIAPVHAEIECLRLALAYEAASQTRLSRLPPLLGRARRT